MLIKKIKTIMDVVMDVAKAIEEEVVLIYQSTKEQVKTHIP